MVLFKYNLKIDKMMKKHGTEDTYTVEKIVGHEVKYRTTYLKIKWKGWDEIYYEPLKNFI